MSVRRIVVRRRSGRRAPAEAWLDLEPDVTPPESSESESESRSPEPGVRVF
jgi:hypothetical protein